MHSLICLYCLLKRLKIFFKCLIWSINTKISGTPLLHCQCLVKICLVLHVQCYMSCVTCWHDVTCLINWCHFVWIINLRIPNLLRLNLSSGSVKFYLVLHVRCYMSVWCYMPDILTSFCWFCQYQNGWDSTCSLAVFSFVQCYMSGVTCSYDVKCMMYWCHFVWIVFANSNSKTAEAPPLHT